MDVGGRSRSSQQATVASVPSSASAQIGGRRDGFRVDGGERLFGGISVNGAYVTLETILAGECLVADFALVARLAVAVDEVAMSDGYEK